MWLVLQPPTQITILSPVACKNPSALAFQMSYPLSTSTMRPSKLALFCLSLFIFSHAYASRISFEWPLKGHVSRATSLSTQHETALRSVSTACLLSPFFRPLLCPSSFPPFPFSLPPFLSIFLPSFLSFFFRFRVS